jgi:hypothetical protein
MPIKKTKKPTTICTDCKKTGTKADFRYVGHPRCPNCDSVEVIPLKKTGLCKVCFEPSDTCYLHCHNAKNGKHLPDMLSLRVADGYDGSVLDVPCKHCGVSGSVVINPDDIRFE